MMPAEHQKTNPDYLLLLVTFCLVGLGLLMLLSSSATLAQKRFNDPYYFFRPQVVHILLGFSLMLLTRYVPYQWLCRLSYLVLLATLLGLALVLVPGIGHRAGGSTRWLRFGLFSIQPSEVAKLSLVIYLAYSLAAKQDKIKLFAYGLFPNLSLIHI